MSGLERGLGLWLGIFLAGTAAACALALVTCGRANPDQDPLTAVSGAVVFNPVVGQGLEWTVKYTGQSPALVSSGVEDTVAAIGPQASPAGCTSGALMGTYGGNQSLVRATLPCLSPSNCMSSGPSPQPQPASTYLSNTVLCSTSSTPKTGFVRSPDNHVFTDAEVARVGPTSILHFDTGAAPAFLNNCTARNFNPSPDVPNGLGYFVNFYRRSDDCGANWPGPAAADGSVPYTKFHWVDSAFNIDWNFDMPHIYVDPFNVSGSGKPYVYVHGTVAVAARGVIESGDAGSTFPNKHYIGDSGLTKNDGFTVGGSMTSTSDGTQFYAGCFFQDVRLYYSQDRWQTYKIMTLTWNGGSTACDELNPWPANGSQGNVGPYAVSVSRVAYSYLKPNYARIRVAYPTLTTVGGQQRQAYNVLEVGVPRKASTGAPYQTDITTLGGTANVSILEAGFVEPDPFETPRAGNAASHTELPDTAIFWSVEADPTVPSLMARYRTWQGAASFSVPRDLSPVSWAYTNSQWVGDYNRGAYYYDSAAKRGNYVLVWPQGDQALPTKSTVAQPHYNVITMRPALDVTTVNVETLNFGSTVNSGPAVSSQGVNKLDIFWVDQNGSLTEKSYSNGWVAGLTSIGAPPAPANGIQGDPAAVSWGTGRNDVFMRGNDNRLYQAWRDSSPWNWNPNALTTQTISSNPAVASMGFNKLHIFARFSDGSVRYLRWTSAGWDTSWTNLGGVTDLDPTATYDTTTMHLFARGGGNCIYHKWTSDGTTWFPGQLTWENLCYGLPAATAPAAASWGPGRLDLFAGNATGAGGNTVMHLAYENGWQTEWNDLQTNRNGIVLGSWPDAVSWGGQRVDVFAKAANGTLWHTWYSMP